MWGQPPSAVHRAQLDPAPSQKHAKKAAPTRPMVTVDFTGSDPQVEGSVNAVAAISYSACFYVFRCLLAEDVPAAAGLMRPIEVIAPAGTIVNARPPAAVAGGNVETSQRIVDVLLKALCPCDPRPHPGGRVRNHEQPHHRRYRSANRRALHLLRNHRRRHGSAPGQERHFRRPHSHDELPEHSRRGARIRLSTPRSAIFAAAEAAGAQASFAAATASPARSNCSPTAMSRCWPIDAPAVPGD